MSRTPVSNDLGSSASDRLASLAHETIDHVTPKVRRAEHEARSAATKTADRARLLQEHAMEAAEEDLRKVRSFIETNPLTTASIAFAAGVWLMSLIRR